MHEVDEASVTLGLHHLEFPYVTDGGIAPLPYLARALVLGRRHGGPHPGMKVAIFTTAEGKVRLEEDILHVRLFLDRQGIVQTTRLAVTARVGGRLTWIRGRGGRWRESARRPLVVLGEPERRTICSFTYFFS